MDSQRQRSRWPLIIISLVFVLALLVVLAVAIGRVAIL